MVARARVPTYMAARCALSSCTSDSLGKPTQGILSALCSGPLAQDPVVQAALAAVRAEVG